MKRLFVVLAVVVFTMAQVVAVNADNQKGKQKKHHKTEQNNKAVKTDASKTVTPTTTSDSKTVKSQSSVDKTVKNDQQKPTEVKKSTTTSNTPKINNAAKDKSKTNDSKKVK